MKFSFLHKFSIADVRYVSVFAKLTRNVSLCLTLCNSGSNVLRGNSLLFLSWFTQAPFFSSGGQGLESSHFQGSLVTDMVLTQDDFQASFLNHIIVHT